MEGAGLSAEAEDRRQLVAQLSLMRDQLKVETGARIESQVRGRGRWRGWAGGGGVAGGGVCAYVEAWGM